MGTVGDLSRRIKSLEARRRDPEKDLPEHVRTRIRVSRMYMEWDANGRGPKPDLAPEEVEDWEYCELIEKLHEELLTTYVPGVPVGEDSPQLKARWDDWYNRDRG